MSARPLATYRIQFRPEFGFADCRKIVGYLADLGMSHIYASPVFQARPGSSHGYDVCDPRRLNPELGGDKAFQGLQAAVRKAGLGWIQDIVPNHMAVDWCNPLLQDVLENGPASRYYEYLDIDWEHPYTGMHGRMLAPFLGDNYARVLERGEISLRYDESGFSINYYDLRFPVRLDSYATILTRNMHALRRELGPDHLDYVKLQGILYGIKGLASMEAGAERYDQIYFIKKLLHETYATSEPVRRYVDASVRLYNAEEEGAGQGGEAEDEDGFRYDLLDRLLAEQYFRLSFWKVATEELNYRRFFSINDLICLRVEDERVFEHVHGLILDKVRSGEFSGLRIDHIDGLYDPTRYLQRLREKCGSIPIYVEKILTGDEPLPTYWPVQGTTGYEFMNAVGGLFTRTENARAFTRLYTRFTGRRGRIPALVAEKKRGIIDRHMAGDVDNLARLVKGVASTDRYGFDMTLSALKKAITEVLVHFPVYRTYLSEDAMRPVELSYVQQAITAAREHDPDLGNELDFLERFLMLRFDDRLSEERRRTWLHFVMRFQQATGPLMAKGYEDTALYVYNRLLSCNEVGGELERFGLSAKAFHGWLAERAKRWPWAMSATATHDTKRGEDARLRLAALSELPELWDETLRALRKATGRRKRRYHGGRTPQPNDEYMLYQVLLANWPFRESEREQFVERLQEFLVKALREGKERSGWLNPDTEYEDGLLKFVRSVLSPRSGGAFLDAFLPLQQRVAHLGVVYSLGQALLKATAPGTPDYYQGCELWDLSFVDPDNRRPVDYGARSGMLKRLRAARDKDPAGLLKRLLDKPEDGRVKLLVAERCLAARQEHPDLFLSGEYVPLEFEGSRAEQAFGFARRLDRGWAVSVLPRRVGGMLAAGQYPVAGFWEDTRLRLPEDAPAGLRNVFSETRVASEEGLVLRDVLRDFPVALLLGESGEDASEA